MSIQLVLLKSGEEVIADVKELRDDSDDLLSYVFKNPYTIKIKTAQVLKEGKGSPKHEARCSGAGITQTLSFKQNINLS